MRYLLVFNPQAGNGRAAKSLNTLLTALGQHDLALDTYLTTDPGAAIRHLAELDLDQYSGVIAAGGDGTLYEVINGYYRNPSTSIRPPVGVLPMGTGNAFIRDMNLAQSGWESALEVILAGNTREVDVGRFTTEGGTFHFMNILGLGFVADVGAVAQRLKFLGNLSYTLGVLYRTIFLAPHEIEITVNGEVLERENLFVEISNTRYTSNFLMAPAAEVDDGLLDVTLLASISRRKLITSFPKILTGEHVELPEVETFQASRIEVRTNVPKILTPDGELMGSTPLRVECLKQAVRVFWP